MSWFEGKVLDAGIFDGVPDTYRGRFPEFYILADNRNPLGRKHRFVFDFDRLAWVWDEKYSMSTAAP